MSSIRVTWLAFVMCSASMICSFVPGRVWAADAKPTRAKYVFLLIGDGMGASQRKAAEMYKRIEADAKPGEEAGQLLMNRFPVKGLTTTSPDGGGVTDSAAAATALACGKKTKNGRIAVSADKGTKFKSIAYSAKEAGMKVGIVSSVPLDHATPAAFYACEGNRGNYYEIAVQAASSGFDYFAGHYFIGGGKGKLKGRKHPAEIAREAGYAVYRDAAGLEGVTRDVGKILWELDIPFVLQHKKGQVTLANLTSKGIEVLENDKGFFLMVEGGKIDWAGHANNLASNIKETLDFDAAIGIVFEFYRKHPTETLIVVTGDHECGGMKTSFTGAFDPQKFAAAVKAQKVSGVEFKKKLKAWKKEGTLKENVLTHIGSDFGITDLTDKEKADLEKVIAYTMKDDSVDARPEELKMMYGSKNMITNACQTIIARRCGVMWTSTSHTSAAVATTAIGSESERFAGQTDNTDIAKTLRDIIEK